MRLDHVDRQIERKEEEAGVRKLVKRRTEEGVLCFPTDKSGRFSVDEVENFSSKMTAHLEGCREVDIDEVERIEREMNARAKVWARILDIGGSWNHGERVKQAVVSASSQPPPIYGLSKDHKVIEEGEPPLRPVCGASSGPGSRISNILAMIIKPFNDRIADDFWFDSTEDLQARIQEVNSLNQQDRSDLVCFSMDAKALYPNIQVSRSASVVRELIEHSDVVIRGVDSLELARYLAVNLTDREISEANLEELVMTR